MKPDPVSVSLIGTEIQTEAKREEEERNYLLSRAPTTSAIR